MRLRMLFAACLIGSTACDSTPARPTPASCAFSLSASSFSIGADGGTGSITVTTGAQCAWTARSDVSWITVAGAASTTGTAAVGFTVAAAPTEAARSGTLQVGGHTVTVQQQARSCTYVVQPDARSFDASGGTGVFDVNTTAPCAWTASSSVAWVSLVSVSSGSGNATVAYRVDTNPGTTTRTGTLSVGGAVHTINQAAACHIQLSRDADTMAVGGGTGGFDVTTAAACGWTAASTVAWMRVTDPPAGSATGPHRVTYAVDANPGAAARTGTVVVGGRTFTLTQLGAAGCAYLVAPTDVRACMAEGFGRTISVTTDPGCPWTAASTASWLSIGSGASGTGSGTISLSMSSNFDAARQAVVEVRWPTVTAGQNVRVAQAGCWYGVSRDSIDVTAAGGTVTFDVISSSTDNGCGGPLQDGCVWSAVSSAPWVTVTSLMPRTGDNPVTLRVDANGTGSARTAVVTVRDRTVTIRQAGA